MDKRELMRTMREGHDRMGDLIAQIPDQRLLEVALDHWTGKDVLAHMAWWHDHSAGVIEDLRAGRSPHDANDPAYSTDAINDRVQREHADDPPDVARAAFGASFARLLAALEPVTDDELFAANRWPWLGGEPLAEMIQWDSSRHYDAHRQHLEQLLPKPR